MAVMIRGYASVLTMFRISTDTPAYYLTSVTKDRLPVFRTEAIKAVACKGLNEARTSGKFLIFVYVFMPDHLHVITDGLQKAERILRFINGIIGRRVIDFLKQQGHLASLAKLRHEDYGRRHRYSLWDHHPNIRLLTNEAMFMQRVHYTHQNPVRAGLVDNAENYKYSSARIWNRRASDDEPLLVDIDKILWRRKK